MAAEKFIIEIRTKGFKTANKSLESVTKQTRAFSREANKGSSVAASFRRNMSGLRNNLLLVSFAFGTVALAFKKFVDASSGFENVKTRLTGLMGSTERAERAFKNFNAVAATTPFSLQDVVEAGAQLKAFGADAEGMIKPVTDLAAFMGTTATEAANSLGRAFAGGAGAADILRERGILNLVKSFNNIDDLSKITLPEFREALENALIDPAAGIAGSTERMSKTFTGAFSNMTDAITRLAANIGDTFMPALKNATIGLGEFASETDRFLKFVKNGRTDFDVFGDTIDDFGIKIEALTVKQLEAELATLNKQMADSKKPIEEAAESTISFGDNMTFIRDNINASKDGVVTLSEVYGDFSGQLGVTEGITFDLVDLFKNLDKVQKEATTTQVATNVNAQVFEERINAINAELERRAAINPDLEKAQKNFNKLLEETALAQIKNIDAAILEIETNAALIGSTEEVAAVLQMLKEKRDDLSGASKQAKEDEKAAKQSLKDMEDQAFAAAAAVTALASGFQTMGRAGASQEDKMKALLQMVGQLAMIFIPGGSGKLVGAGISAISGFIGHTGGLIQNNGIQRFAAGGMVQGQDNVPIMAQAGEFIMQRSAVSDIGLQNLAQMNQTGQSAAGVTINIAGNMVGEEDHIRTNVLPAIKEELRREANA